MEPQLDPEEAGIMEDPMQQTHARATRARETRIVRCLAAIPLAAAAVAVAACHDAPTSVVAPVPPALAVTTDGAWLVNSLADPGDGVCSNSECTLREAIAAAQSGDRITFKSNLIGTIGLTAGVLLVDKSLTIDGLGADQLTVSGQGASLVFQIGDVDSVVVALSGLTITGGTSTLSGGGMVIKRPARLVLVGSLVTGNSTSGSGGGIYSEGSLTVVGSTIAANKGPGGGGGIFAPDGKLTVIRSTISGNSASSTSYGGGGIFSDCSTAWCGPTTIRSSTITQNEASSWGGGLALGASATTMSNTIVAGNRSGLEFEADCSGGFKLTSLGYNLSTLDTGCDLAGSTDVNVTLSSQVITFVLLPVLANNGGRLPTHALIERGLAVDAGYCPGEGGDQRGFPRPYDDPRIPNALDACDIGSFEWNPPDAKGKGPKP
jgi:CSLREA domain-containing protein